MVSNKRGDVSGYMGTRGGAIGGEDLWPLGHPAQVGPVFALRCSPKSTCSERQSY